MDELLRQVQMAMLDSLMYFDKICRKYDIKYSLHGGTLLGAIRHKGFIPWDDDLDVIMPRSEYNRFMSAWYNEKHEGFFLQTKETEEDYTRSFAKIRKEHTTFLQHSENPSKIHTGVFIDVFPSDRIPNGKINSLIFKYSCLKYQLYTREFVPPKANPLVKIYCKFLLSFTNHSNRMKRRKVLLKRIRKYEKNTNLRWVVIESPRHLSKPFPPDFFEEFTEIEFENKEFMCISKWKQLLESWYGDYMKLPPTEEQTWKHHPALVDLKHSYNER